MLESLCQSDTWNDDQLDGLGLLGLQPCFEDVILQMPVYLSLIVISVYRSRKCYYAGPLKPKDDVESRVLAYLKMFLCATNAMTNLVLISVIEEPAVFEQLVIPFGILAWLCLTVMTTLNYFHFTYRGQWMPRFCFFWVFVMTSVRWPSQHALGDIPGQAYYVNAYSVMWATQFLLVGCLYFEKPYSFAEYNEARGAFDEVTQDGDDDGVEMEERHNTMTFSLTGHVQSGIEEETGEMRTVPWTESKNPEAEANFLSRLIFYWMDPLFSYAHKHELELEDIFDIRKHLRAHENSAVFETVWENEKEHYSGDKPSLTRALIKGYFWIIFPAAPLLMIQNVAQLSLPFLLGPLIEFMDNDQPVYIGYLYAVGFFIGLMIMTLAENAYFDRVVKTGVRVRAALVPSIYKHAMKMSNDARQERSIGAIVNHMAADTEKLQMYCQSINNLWSAPFRLSLGILLLITSLGVAGVFGVIAVCMVIPFQTYVIKKGAVMFKEVMKKSDSRIKILNEVLSGMRVIKYYAWERPFEEKVKNLRDDELSSLKSAQNYRALQSFFMNFNPVALSIGTFVAYAALKGNISPAQAFQALALFQQMIWPLMLLPQAYAQLTETLVAVERIESYLLTPTCDEAKLIEDVSLDESGFPNEMEKGHVRISNSSPEISIQSGYFSWGQNSAAQLIDINLDVRPGELLAIVGPTGSGKSSLVNAILGEMNVITGRAKLCGSAAYAPQQAWIYNATVRDNIIFGNEFDEKLYNSAIDVSCLRKDIEKQFDAGDQTEIGEKGINMSGGQRQRLNIARSVYSNADIFIFDDPLSALDAHVTADVFRLCIKEKLRDKTRVLVTNQLHLMPQVDRIVVMNNGKIQQQGTFEELHADENGEFYRLYSENINADEGDGDDEGTGVDKPEKIGVDETDPKDVDVRKRAPSVIETKELIPLEAAKDEKNENKKDIGKLIQKEKHATGTIKWAVYAGYLTSLGWIPLIVTVVMNVGSAALSLASSVWLGVWAGDAEDPEHTVVYYISIYVVLSVLTVVTLLIGSLAGYSGAVNASRKLHAELISSLMRAPISFFDSTPLGRITNRMSKDVNMVDNATMMVLQLVLKGALGLLGTLIIIGINTTYVLVPFVPIITIFIAVQNYFRATSVQLKRLDAVSRSPLYAHFTESLNGLSTIRAYLAQTRMTYENSHKLDENQRVFVLAMTSNRWLSIRLEFLGGLLIMITAINCVLLRNSLSAAAAGIAMAYSLQITTQLNMMVRMITELENSFNSVERIQEYTNLESEADLKGPEYPPNDWPSKGKIEMEELVVSYRPGLPPVIKGVNLVIEPSMKIGVCGRTGAGKSTLFQVLFRMMEASSGKLTFDGIDVSSLGLEDVRNAISIIPQEPVLFSGTLRSNLDPFEKYSDADIWNALEKASLREVLTRRGENLHMKVSEGGENFSVGQRQLICLARALLRKTKLLVLDEATANVDVETDALIQQTIRDNFADRTTLTIAHRLNTIIDCDKILVLELGSVKEYDTPKNLMNDINSEFYSMVQETGPQNAAFLRAVALGLDEASTERCDLVRAAKEHLASAPSGGQIMEGGPLMKSIYAAANTFQSGWENRRADNWTNELRDQAISLKQWMDKMAELLERVNNAAESARFEEARFGLQGPHGSNIFGDDSLRG